MKRIATYPLFVTLLLVVLLAACKGKNDWENPFDDPALQPPPDTSGNIVLSPTSIEGLHRNIFRPTCANSGCHDGTFEPDFRSIESTYYTLVWHPVVKNDTMGSYRFRVFPGMADSSVIINRLTRDIDGQSGLMPIIIDPGSDWPTKKEQYIQNIRDWINDGARDMFGNAPSAGNFQPMVGGILAFANGSSTPLSRQPGKGPLRVPPGTTQLDVWFSITDAETPPTSLGYNKVKFSTTLNGFDNLPELDLVTGTPFTAPGYLGDVVTYQHKVTVDPSVWSSEMTIFFRVYVNDGAPVVTEIPNYGSENYFKKYAALFME